jgi:hypothetical protein
VKNFLFCLIAVIIGFSAAYGLAEIAVRIISPQETGPPRFAFDPELGEIPVPLQKGRQRHPGGYDFTYSNNSLGFRGSREYGPKPAGTRRILLLGDSFTYGLGVDDDQTFAAELERELGKRYLPAEVINAGNPGRGTDYELKLFQTVGAGLKPEVTVLCFFSNDFQDNARGEYYDVEVGGGLRIKPLEGNRGSIKTFLLHLPGYNWLISWSQAANLVKQAAVHHLVQAGKDRKGQVGAASGLVVSYETGYDGLGYSNETNRKLTAIYLDHLREAVKRAGSELLVVYIPLASEVETYRQKREISRDEQAIKEIIEARGGTLKSLTPPLASAPVPIRELYYAEGHWTPRAHLQVGRYLGDYIASQLQAKPLPRSGRP